MHTRCSMDRKTQRASTLLGDDSVSGAMIEGIPLARSDTYVARSTSHSPAGFVPFPVREHGPGLVACLVLVLITSAPYTRPCHTMTLPHLHAPYASADAAPRRW
jgi:hypothetical protein